jgi:CheY-like chemotaxis protein/nitrogen-specific signal transduction histidine kinase
VERKNAEVEQARQALEEKARQLALTSKYKSEFLANMSHELRTPLNSLLILSDQLCKNPGGNLMPKQVEFAKTIHASGNDLLTLINDILDLSKIESGTVVMDPSDVRLDELQRYVERTFRHVAEAKGVDFFLRVDPRLPPTMFADLKRLQQVLKNLLSNAFKFTHQGSVTLTMDPVTSGWDAQNETLNRASEVIAISVRDTGIGISPDKQQIIFEAFQQADGSTSRKYGGTGLGLAISRELTRLLGGEIRLTSAPRSGSTFTLFLPVTYTPPRSLRKVASDRALADAAPRAPSSSNVPSPVAKGVDLPPMPETKVPPAAHPEPAETPELDAEEAGDDRHAIGSGDRVLLIVENDVGFSQLLLEAARDKGFKGIVTSSGVSALALAAEYTPSAVTLDIFLPDIDGWRVLDRLKNDDLTRHVPVTVISTDEARERALKSGAFQFAAKPMQSKEVVDALLDRLVAYLQRARRHLLAVAPDATRRTWFEQALAANDVKVTAVASYDDAATVIAREPVDCLVFDGALAPPPEGLFVQEGNGMAASDGPPILLYGEGKDVNEFDHWGAFAKRPGVREVRSPERLLEQASFCLHRALASMPDAHRTALRELRNANEVLQGRKVMIVDDDMRNIFALTSLLEDRGMVIVSHDNGRDAVTALNAQPNVEAILMDIMMPEMDGIDTIREIRQIPACRDTPIIAVTAKAMKGDREKCMEAGAWDYLSKPVDTELMLGCLRGWLSR